MFTFAHLTDPHLPPLPPVAARQLAGKRLLGYLSWHRKRKREHRTAVLQALARDLARSAPDHVFVGGDVTNLGLASEMDAAARWLDTLGPRHRVSFVPGNHDAYTATAAREIAARFAPWLGSDDDDAVAGSFPWLRTLAGVAFIGASTAVPSMPFRATGRLGVGQLARLRAALQTAARMGHPRILLIHHPPQHGAVPGRRALSDAPALRRVLAETGCELVLHGHGHAPMRAELPGPDAPIPVLGTGSASLAGDRRGRTGHYRVLTLDDEGTLRVRGRRYDPEREEFVGDDAEDLVLPRRARPAASA